MAEPRIFVSMGSPYTAELLAFRDALETLLRDRCGVDPRIIGKNEYPTASPLTKIIEVMRECHGLVLVANERKFVELGKEKRGSPQETELQRSRYTTPWNHIESAIAYSLGLPIYVISQTGVHPEGLIESKSDWPVQEIDFEPAVLESPPVLDSLRAWVDERVRPHHRGEGATTTERKSLLSFRLSDFTLHDWAVIVPMAVGLVLLGAVIDKLDPRLLDLFSSLKGG